MNILQINTTDTGGAAKACIRLHIGLLKAGINSKVLVVKKQSIVEILECYEYQEQAKIIQNESEYNHLVQLLKELRKGYEPFQIPYSLYDIENHPLYEWADIIHLHWVAGFLDWKTFFEKNKKPIVWTLHDLLPFTGGYHYEKGFPINEYNKWIEKNIRLKKEALSRQNLSLIALSNWLLDKSKSSQLFHSYKHTLIPNGLDSTLFKPYETSLARRALKLPLDTKLILFVAAHTANKRKGINYLLDALDIITDEVSLVIIGDTTDLVIDRPNVYELGKIWSDAYLTLAYSAVELFVHPSIEDNLPNTVLESLFCGTPVVAFDIGGNPDMIQPQKNGLLCKSINSKDLGATIQKGLNFIFDRHWIREDAVARFEQKEQVAQIIQLYESKLSLPKDICISSNQMIDEKKVELQILDKEISSILLVEEIAQHKSNCVKLNKDIERYKEEVKRQKVIRQQKVDIIIEQNKVVSSQKNFIENQKRRLNEHESIPFLIRKTLNLIISKFIG